MDLSIREISVHRDSPSGMEDVVALVSFRNRTKVPLIREDDFRRRMLSLEVEHSRILNINTHSTCNYHAVITKQKHTDIYLMTRGGWTRIH